MTLSIATPRAPSTIVPKMPICRSVQDTSRVRSPSCSLRPSQFVQEPIPSNASAPLGDSVGVASQRSISRPTQLRSERQESSTSATSPDIASQMRQKVTCRSVDADVGGLLHRPDLQRLFEAWPTLGSVTG